jgi:hypothetical protein
VLALESLLELLLVLLGLYPLLGVVVLGDDRDRILSARRRRAAALDSFDAAIVGASDEDAKRAGLDAELEGVLRRPARCRSQPWMRRRATSIVSRRGARRHGRRQRASPGPRIRPVRR